MYKLIYEKLNGQFADLQPEKVEQVMNDIKALSVHKSDRKVTGDETPGKKVRLQSGRSEARSQSSVKQETESQRSQQDVHHVPADDNEDFLLEQRSTIKAEIVT
jgi:hypothetical protein